MFLCAVRTHSFISNGTETAVLGLRRRAGAHRGFQISRAADAHGGQRRAGHQCEFAQGAKELGPPEPGAPRREHRRRVCGMFYKATVLSVLLFGSETWCLTQTQLKRLEGFQVRSAHRMAVRNRLVRKPDGMWTYPATADVFDEVGLRTMEEHMRVRRDTITRYMVEQPLLEAYRDGE